MTPTVRRVVAEVCARHNVSAQDLLGDSRVRRIAWPRQEAMALIYATGKLSLPQIGAAFSRDHTTVLSACRAYARRSGPQSGTNPVDEGAPPQGPSSQTAVV